MVDVQQDDALCACVKYSVNVKVEFSNSKLKYTKLVLAELLMDTLLGLTLASLTISRYVSVPI